MTAGRYTSRVFVCGEAIYDALTGASLPAHPTTGEVPPVVFSDEDPDETNEYVTVQLNTDETSTDWRRLSPAGRDEFIRYEVTARTYVPGVESSAALWDRLEALSTVIEGIVYDTSTEAVVKLDYPGEVWTRVAAVAPVVGPTKEGWIGAVTVSFDSLAQI